MRRFTSDMRGTSSWGWGHYLSLDPYMRGRMSAAKSYAKPVEINDVMVGATRW
jgi:hypothetical protein